MVRPKLILDTNVCSKLLSPAYSGDLERIKAKINRNFRVVISPETFLELLETFSGDDGTHFESDRNRLRVMSGGQKPIFLRFPGAFVLWKVLGVVSTAAKFHPRDFERWFRLVLRAKSLDHMVSGLVRDPLSSRISYRFSPSKITSQQNDGKAAHRASLKEIREAGEIDLPGTAWAAAIADSAGHRITEEQAIRLLESLDAAYRYRAELRRLVCSGTFNVDKHLGDWIDGQQLFYLCDPKIHFLTDDREIKKRVAGSNQADRILLLRDFLTAHGFTPRH